MALNYAPISQCVSLIVANQFRAMKQNPNSSSVSRAKYVGNTAGSGSELLPFMSKTGKGRKSLTRVKCCHECGKKFPNKEKFKICRPRFVASSSTDLNPNLKLPKVSRLLKRDKTVGSQKLGDISVSKVAQEMIECFNKFIDHLYAADNAVKLQKMTNNIGMNKSTCRSTALKLTESEIAKLQKSPRLAKDAKKIGHKTTNKKAKSERYKYKTSDVVRTYSFYDTNVQNKYIVANKTTKTSTLKDSLRDAQFLEIHPKCVENIRNEQELLNFKDMKCRSHKVEDQTNMNKENVMLTESTNSNITKNNTQLRNANSVPCNEKGFILLYPEDAKENKSNYCCSNPGEKGFILLNSNRLENEPRRSKDSGKNFILVGDNPFSKTATARTKMDENKTSQVSNVKADLLGSKMNVQVHMSENDALGCASLSTKYGRNINNRISSILENQTVGSSDSKEELRRRGENVNSVEMPSLVTTNRLKPGGGLHFQQLKLGSNSSGKMLEKTLNDVSNGQLSKIGGFPGVELTTTKKIDDSANGSGVINIESIIEEDTRARNCVKTEGSVGRKDVSMDGGVNKDIKKRIEGLHGNKGGPKTIGFNSGDLNTGGLNIRGTNTTNEDTVAANTSDVNTGGIHSMCPDSFGLSKCTIHSVGPKMIGSKSVSVNTTGAISISPNTHGVNMVGLNTLGPNADDIDTFGPYTTVSNSGHGLHTGEFGNALNEGRSFDLESKTGRKKRREKRNVTQAHSFENVRVDKKTGSSCFESSPVSCKAGQKTETVLKSQSGTSENKAERAECNSKYQRSSVVSVNELKPDLSKKKINADSSKNNIIYLKGNTEPQLTVKPEEIFAKSKHANTQETGKRCPNDGHISNQDAAPLYGNLFKSKEADVPTSSLKSSLGVKQEPVEMHTMKCQEMNTRNESECNQKEKFTEMSKISPSETNEFSLTTSQGTSLKPNKGVSMAEVFQQFHLAQKTQTPRSSQTANTNFNVGVSEIKTSRRNDDLIRELRQQWTRDFQEKYRNNQFIDIYPLWSKDDNIFSKEASKNCNTSAGNKLAKKKKKKKTSLDVESMPKSKSSPSVNIVQVNRKSEYLPTMGMAERLLAASQNPSRSSIVNSPCPEVRDSETSMNTDATVTPGAAEVSDFPEIDQFEDWIQSKMPDVLGDDKGQVTQTGNSEIEKTSQETSGDAKTLSNIDPLGDYSFYEGSNVDGYLTPPAITQQPEKSYCGSPEFENIPYYDVTRAKISGSHEQCDKNIAEISKRPKRKLSERSVSLTNTSLRREASANTINVGRNRHRSQHNLTTDTMAVSNDFNPGRKIYHTGFELPPSNITNAKPDSPVTHGRSKMLGSLDGFASLTLISDPEMPEKSTKRQLKSTLRRSPSRERGEEKRVSFMKTPNKDDCQPVKDSYSRQQFDRFVGSSVDGVREGENFSGGNNSQECDLRNELSEKRKRMEMEARIKLLNEHSKQIREYEAILSKYRDIVAKFKNDALKAIRGYGSESGKSSEV